MKIWLDTTHFTLSTNQTNKTVLFRNTACYEDEGCPKENDNYPGDIPSISNVPVLPTLSTDDRLAITTHTFVCSPTLYTQPCDDRLWLVCNPTVAGNVALIDEQAHTLLSRFATPTTLLLALDSITLDLVQATRALKLFTQLGFVYDQNETAQPAPAQTPRSQTLAAWLHVTNACNLGCSYCYVQKTSEPMDNKIMLRSIDAIIRSATRSHYNHIHLTYAGGEATLQLPQVLAAHDYALQQTASRALTLSANIITNGAALPIRSIAQLKQRKIGVLVSLDGVGETHDQQRPFVNGQGSFSFVDRTITRLLANGLVPTINVTVTQRNLHDLPQLLEYVLARKLPFGLSYYRDNENSTHLADLQFTEQQMIAGMQTAFTYIEAHLPERSLLGSLVDKINMRSPRQYSCGVGRNYLVIDQRGGVTKCQADIKNTLTTIDAPDPLQVIRADRGGVQAVPVEAKEGCQTCEWQHWCTGGCPLLTYRLTGRSDIKSPNCNIYKALFPGALHLEGQRLLRYTSPLML